jgi:hypothetical protein
MVAELLAVSGEDFMVGVTATTGPVSEGCTTQRSRPSRRSRTGCDGPLSRSDYVLRPETRAPASRHSCPFGSR